MTTRAVHVLVPIEEGVVRDVEVFATEEDARRTEQKWLSEHGLTSYKDRGHASDWGTGIAIWQCQVKP